jgi:hypothetical protein
MRTTSRCTRTTKLRAGIIALTLLCAAAAPRPAFAGPPLLCHPFDIGSAKSLPWSGVSSWSEGQAGYDIKRLADDTVALLTPATPVIARMETLRRAAIYASRDTNVARQLLLIVTDRTRPDASGKTDPLALFDAGYLTETLREVGRVGEYNNQLGPNAAGMTAFVKNVDGYALVQKSLALRPGDGSIELASALIAASAGNRKAEYASHAQRARTAAKQDALLERNLSRIAE